MAVSLLRQHAPIVLASGSAVRHRILESWGVRFEAIVSKCDEDALVREYQGRIDNEGICALLAAQKAKMVSSLRPQAYVIGSDQICDLDGMLLSKPANSKMAAEQLRLLSGKTHRLVSCASIFRDGVEIERGVEVAELKMRELNEDTISTYLSRERPYQSCGSYMYEKNGKFLFEQVQGSLEAILGLPQQFLLNALFRLGVIDI